MSHEDERAIERLKHEYCFAIDGGHHEAWAALFTEDGRFVRDNGDTYAGHDDLARFSREEFAPAFAHSAHVVTNPVIDVAGEAATGQWYLLMFYRTAAGATGWTQARYEDAYRNVEGEWKIADSTLTYGVYHEF
jgi:uncharacterized protein (TIGR02246 family)